MQAQDISLCEFMGSKNDFIIPVYQRNYDWEEKHCEKLFDDIEYIHKYELEEYFMGSFTVVAEEESNKLIVIDGQQRLTTLSLLLLAMYNLMRDGDIEINESLHTKILNEYLITDQCKPDKKQRIKLKQVNQDSGIYECLFLTRNEFLNTVDPEKYQGHPIYENYQYLKTRVKNFCKGRENLQSLFSAIEKMRIVQIELRPKGDGDKPQLVFESINATGKKLSDADLIRNFILMDKPDAEQRRIFENYWKPIEQNTRFKIKAKNEEHTSDFIWYFLMCEKNQKLSKKNVYSDFKTYVNDHLKNDDAFDKFLEKLKTFSGYYKNLAYEGGETYQGYYQTLRYLSQTTCYTYLLSLIDHYKNNHQHFAMDMHTILKFIINYYVRGLVCKETTNKYAEFFPTVAEKIEGYQEKKEENYIDAFYRVFANDAPMTSDTEIKDVLSNKGFDFYNLKKCNKYLFGKLVNNDDTKEQIKMENITIEHIMPKTLTDKWRRMLGEKQAEGIHENYLHSLGNLTVTGYNSELGNKPFDEKKKNFADSPIGLNRYFEDIEKWDKQAIEDRTDVLTKKLCDILKYKEELYKYKEEEKYDWDKYYSLEECLSILNKKKRLKPVSYIIVKQNKRRIFRLKTTTWKYLLEYVAEQKEKMNININWKDIYCTSGATSTMKKLKEILTDSDLADDFKIKLTE